MVLTMRGLFSPEQCNQLIATYGDKVEPWRPTPRKRICTHAIQEQWYIDGINRAVVRANETFQFDISGLTDQPALVRYDEGSYFHWHHDQYSGRDGVFRKFSLITIMSSPESHEGGVLEFFDHGKMDVHQPSQGTVFAFPAWLQHRVTEVTKGTRYSAVAFVGGPKFR